MYSFSFQLLTDSVLKTPNLSAPAGCCLPTMWVAYREKKWIQSEDSSGAPCGCSPELTAQCCLCTFILWSWWGSIRLQFSWVLRKPSRTENSCIYPCSSNFTTSIHLAKINFTFCLLYTKNSHSFWFDTPLKKIHYVEDE